MKITLPIPPMSTNHAYHTQQGRWYKDEKMIEWEKESLWKLKGNTFHVTTWCAVSIQFSFGNKRKNDIDGRIKPILDLLEKAGVYKNDSMVTELHVYKDYDKENPRVVIQVI